MDKQIQYRYAHIDTVQFAIFEENFNPECDINIKAESQFSYSNKQQVLFNRLTITALQGSLPIFKAEIVNGFAIAPNSVENLKVGKSQIQFPVFLLSLFASFAYSTARGILFDRLQNTKLKGFILPPIPADKLIDGDFVADTEQ